MEQHVNEKFKVVKICSITYKGKERRILFNYGLYFFPGWKSFSGNKDNLLETSNFVKIYQAYYSLTLDDKREVVQVCLKWTWL